MTHLARARTDADWARGPVPAAAMRDIDENTRKGLNGGEGGAFTPVAPIIISGVGVMVSGPWELKTDSAAITDGNTKRYIFGKKTTDDAFIYATGHAERTRDLHQAISSDSVATEVPSSIMTTSPLSKEGTAGTTKAPFVTARLMGARFFAAIRVHDGSTITRVRLTLRVPTTRLFEAAPEFATRIRVIRISADGRIEALRSQDLVTDQDGFTGPAPASGAVWYVSGNPQTIDYTPTQNAVVDIANYSYFAEIIEEDGVNGGTLVTSALPPKNEYISLVTRCANINLLANRR